MLCHLRQKSILIYSFLYKMFYLPLKDHVNGVVVFDEVVLLLDQEVVHARDVDVHLAPIKISITDNHKQ